MTKPIRSTLDQIYRLVAIAVGVAGLFVSLQAFILLPYRLNQVEEKAEGIEALSRDVAEVRTDVKWIVKILGGSQAQP